MGPASGVGLGRELGVLCTLSVCSFPTLSNFSQNLMVSLTASLWIAPKHPKICH